MTVRLVIEHAAHPQRETSRTWEGGELVIGRGEDAGWQLDDPDQFLSRRHAIVSDIGGVPHITDASRGGLFVDGAASPLGPGNTRALEDGMRLRLGDFVLRVDMQAAAGRAPASPQGGASMSFEFGPAEAPVAPPQRPADLPKPFGAAPPGPMASGAARPPQVSRPLDVDDPFGLDLRSGPALSGRADPGAVIGSGARPTSPFDAPPMAGTQQTMARKAPVDDAPPTPMRAVPQTSPFNTPEPPPPPAKGKGGYFFDDADPPSRGVGSVSGTGGATADPFALGAGFRPREPIVEQADGADAGDDSRTWVRTPPPPPETPPDTPARRPPVATTAAHRDDPAFPLDGTRDVAPPTRDDIDLAFPTRARERPVETATAPTGHGQVEQAVPPRPPVMPGAGAAQGMPPDRQAAPGPDLYAAFLRGAGLPPEASPADAERAMEDAGRHFRAMVDGLMHLLRARAMEKQKVRVAMTVMASANVNPLKTLPTAEDGVAALVRPRGPGYLAPEKAIDAAFRDLADHQVRTWTALQQALRRMIDRFDPAEIEAEMEAAGRMKALLAGGRKALLWQLYEDRYREIAAAAEERFLGEVGADFRDAYEGQTRERE